MHDRMDKKTVRDINSRLFFGSGKAGTDTEIKAWQYVEMAYERIGLRAPADVPELESLEDVEIWMCLDARVNRIMRMRESAMAG